MSVNSIQMYDLKLNEVAKIATQKEFHHAKNRIFKGV